MCWLDPPAVRGNPICCMRRSWGRTQNGQRPPRKDSLYWSRRRASLGCDFLPHLKISACRKQTRVRAGTDKSCLSAPTCRLRSPFCEQRLSKFGERQCIRVFTSSGREASTVSVESARSNSPNSESWFFFFLSKSISVIISWGLTPWSRSKNIYASLTVSASGFKRECNRMLAVRRWRRAEEEPELDLSSLIHLTYVQLNSCCSPVLHQTRCVQYIEVQTTPLYTPLHCIIIIIENPHQAAAPLCSWHLLAYIFHCMPHWPLAVSWFLYLHVPWYDSLKRSQHWLAQPKALTLSRGPFTWEINSTLFCSLLSVTLCWLRALQSAHMERLLQISRCRQEAAESSAC